MKITGLAAKGSKVKIVFDDDSVVIVSYEVTVESGLRKHDELTEKMLDDLIRKNELFEIKNAAFRLLTRRLHSSNELRTKLIKKKYRIYLVDEIIDYLSEKKYLNDLEFAEKFTNEKISFSKIGTTKIRGELIKKGLDRETIDAVILKQQDNPLLLENAVKLAAKKRESYSRKEITSKQMKQKLFQFLNGKGYNTEIILKVISELISDQNDDLN